MYSVNDTVKDLMTYKVISTRLGNVLMRNFDYSRSEINHVDELTLKELADKHTVAEIRNFRWLGEAKFKELSNVYDRLGYYILEDKFTKRKDESEEDKQMSVIDGKVVTGLRMSDGKPVTGFVIGTAPFTYILPENGVRKACCAGQQQVKIEITAERILSHD